MSITITPVLPEGCTWSRPVEYDNYDWCLCAQMASDPCALIHTEEGRKELAKHAEPGCPWCHGTGVSRQDESLYAPSVNWAGENVKIMFFLLGIKNYVSGTLSIGRMQLHVQAANRALELGKGNSRVRPDYREMTAYEDAIVPRVISRGLSCEDMEERLERLEALLKEALSLGCQEVSWS